MKLNITRSFFNTSIIYHRMALWRPSWLAFLWQPWWRPSWLAFLWLAFLWQPWWRPSWIQLRIWILPKPQLLLSPLPKPKLLLLLLPLVFSSCIKEEFNPDVLDPSLQIHPGVAAPIGWARYELEEILEDSINPATLVIGEDGFISLVYTQDIYSLYASEIIDIRDLGPITESLDTDTPIDLSAISGDRIEIPYSVAIQLPVENELAGAEIDSIRLSSVLMDFSTSTDISGVIWDVRILIPGIDNFQVTLSNDTISKTKKLEDISLPLDNTPPNSNTLLLDVILRLDRAEAIIPSGAIINLSIGFTDLDFAAIYGYLGQFSIDVDDRAFNVDFYNEISAGSFYFSDPELSVSFLNSFGLPIDIIMTNFFATGQEGQNIWITGPGVPDPANPKELAYPTVDQQGREIADSIVLNTTNSNLSTVIESSPRQLSVGVSGTTNPAGYTNQNFVLDSSRLEVSSRFVLPMSGYANMLIADTLDFSLMDVYDTPPEEILKLLFRMNYDHQFPLDVETQLYFTNENYVILDSLYHDSSDERRIVEGASDTNGDGIPDPVEPDPTDIELTRDQIDNISDSRYIIVTGRVLTTGYDPSPPDIVRFYSFFYFYAHIGAMAELEINSDDY